MPRLVSVATIPLTPWLFLRGQNAYLREHGFDLHVVASPGPLLDEVADRDGVAVHALPIARTIRPLADVVSALRLYRLLRRLRPEIAHLSTPKAALLGALAARAAGVPVRLYLVRGLVTEGATGARRRLLRAAERLTARLCTAAICVSPSLLRFAREEGILRPDEGKVLGGGMSNGVDCARFAPDGSTPDPLGPDLRDLTGATRPRVVGFVGRITRDKGIEDLAAAWEVLREEHPDLRLLLVGPWEGEDAVSPRWRRALEDDPRVITTGMVADPAPYYRVMDLLAYPSHGTEGFPNAPMEAAASGLPVVATRVIGCVDAVVDGETGALVPPRHPGALASALRRYLADDALRRAHGAAARARAEREFSQERIWEALRAEYVRLLGVAGLTTPSGAAPASS